MLGRTTSRLLTHAEMRQEIYDGKECDCGYSGDFTFEQVLDILHKYKLEGRSVSYRFYNFKVNSDDLPDEITSEACRKICNELNKALNVGNLPTEIKVPWIDYPQYENAETFDVIARKMLGFKSYGETVFFNFMGFELCTDDFDSVEQAEKLLETYIKEQREENSQIAKKESLVAMQEAVIKAFELGVSYTDIKEKFMGTIDELVRNGNPNLARISNNEKTGNPENPGNEDPEL